MLQIEWLKAKVCEMQVLNFSSCMVCMIHSLQQNHLHIYSSVQSCPAVSVRNPSKAIR